MELKEKLHETLCDEKYGNLVSAWNDYCDAVNYCDDYIYFMDDFDEITDGMSPRKVLEYAHSNDFNIFEDYFKFGIYGLQSTNDPIDWIDMDDLEDYMIENEEDFSLGIDFDELKKESEEN